MKRLIKYAILLFAVLAVSCQDDELDVSVTPDAASQIQITSGSITSPQWLVDVIENIAENHNGRTPFVAIVTHGGKQYVHVDDWAESCFTCGQLMFTPTGKAVDYTDPLYSKLLKEQNSQLIWWNGMNDASANTRSSYNEMPNFGSPATIYTPYDSKVP